MVAGRSLGGQVQRSALAYSGSRVGGSRPRGGGNGSAGRVIRPLLTFAGGTVSTDMASNFESDYRTRLPSDSISVGDSAHLLGDRPPRNGGIVNLRHDRWFLREAGFLGLPLRSRCHRPSDWFGTIDDVGHHGVVDDEPPMAAEVVGCWFGSLVCQWVGRLDAPCAAVGFDVVAATVAGGIQRELCSREHMLVLA